MRTKTILLLIYVTLGLMPGLSSSAFAKQDHEATGNLQMPATAGEILAAVNSQILELEKTIAAHALDKVHVKAFEIRDLLLALPEKTSTLSSQGKTALTSSLGKIKQQAGLLDKYGDSGDLAQLKVVFVKFKDEIEKIKQIPGLQP